MHQTAGFETQYFSKAKKQGEPQFAGKCAGAHAAAPEAVAAHSNSAQRVPQSRPGASRPEAGKHPHVG